ncbi:MAG: LamG domain-containing protein [Candidatus Poribacteria bacterium]
MRTAYLAIGIFIILFLFISPSYSKIDPKTCIGLWLFDEGKGDVAGDSSGNKNDGKLMNDPKWVDGKIGKALDFDGAQNHIVVPNSDTLNPTDAITLVAWIYPRGFTGNGNGILTKEGQYILGLNWPQSGNAQKLNLWLTIGGWILFADGEVKKDSWNHVVATYDGSTKKLYIDGKLISKIDQKGKIGTSANNILIAQGNIGVGQQAFNGIIDELAIFNIALTETEIKDAMKGFMYAIEPSGKLIDTWASIKTR